MPLFKKDPNKVAIRGAIGRLDIPPNQVFGWEVTVDNEPGSVSLIREPHRANTAKRFDTFNMLFLGRVGASGLILCERFFFDRSGVIATVTRAYTDPVDAAAHEYREASHRMDSQMVADVADDVVASDYSRVVQMLQQAPDHPSLQTGPIVGE